MKINMFEGARRITYVVAILFLTGTLAAEVYFAQTVLSAGFTKESFDKPFVRSSDECNPPDVLRKVGRTTLAGNPVDVTLCFKAKKMPDGREVLVYGDIIWDEVEKPKDSKSHTKPNKLNDPGDWVTVSRLISDDEKQYVEDASAKFMLSADINQELDDEHRKQFLGMLGRGAMIGICGAALIFLLSWTIGWVVRGFMGVPRGKDQA